MYILLGAIGYAILGVVALLDKFILTKKFRDPAIYTFYTSFPFFFFTLLLFFGIEFPTDIINWCAVVASGLFLFLGLRFMFLGIKESEVSHVGPFIGAVIPVSVVVLSRLFLNEILPVMHLLAIALLVVGSLVISFEKSKKHQGIHIGMLWGLLAGMSFAVSHVASKYAYDSLGFYNGFVISRVVLGICGALLLLSPIVRREIFSKKKDDKKSNKTIVYANIFLAILGVLAVQYAISLGSVSVVNAFEGLKYAILIILVAVFSAFFPKILKEEYSKWEMFQEILAVILIAAGLILLV